MESVKYYRNHQSNEHGLYILYIPLFTACCSELFENSTAFGRRLLFALETHHVPQCRAQWKTYLRPEEKYTICCWRISMNQLFGFNMVKKHIIPSNPSFTWYTSVTEVFGAPKCVPVIDATGHYLLDLAWKTHRLLVIRHGNSQHHASVWSCDGWPPQTNGHLQIIFLGHFHLLTGEDPHLSSLLDTSLLILLG